MRFIVSSLFCLSADIFISFLIFGKIKLFQRKEKVCEIMLPGILFGIYGVCFQNDAMPILILDIIILEGLSFTESEYE